MRLFLSQYKENDLEINSEYLLLCYLAEIFTALIFNIRSNTLSIRSVSYVNIFICFALYELKILRFKFWSSDKTRHLDFRIFFHHFTDKSDWSVVKIITYRSTFNHQRTNYHQSTSLPSIFRKYSPDTDDKLHLLIKDFTPLIFCQVLFVTQRTAVNSTRSALEKPEA